MNKNINDFTVCMGVGCRVRTKCQRYGMRPNPNWQSYMAACVKKVAFVGKPKWKKTY